MSKLTYFIVDAFTTESFKGNSAAVVLLDHSVITSDSTLQAIATESNLAETAFVDPIDAEAGHVGLRWFTPTTEFPLCGHATLATAFVLFSSLSLPQTVKQIKFETLSGILTAKRICDGRIELELPASESSAVQNKPEIDAIVIRAFHRSGKLTTRFVGKGSGVVFGKYLLVEVADVSLENCTIDPLPLAELFPQYEVIIFTHRGDNGRSTFISRVFCPREALPEDPVTGSAHCMLGPYWATRLGIAEVQEMAGRQASERSGDVGVIWDRRRRVCLLRGNAKVFSKGELYL
ncbi:Diaminopimelate epimerase-like protein [Hysterangium stoloniferum]|nr:Diaminopimelate epimerase-like protein [Hysterangium stoloniferum]